jgi:hypothetical protein
VLGERYELGDLFQVAKFTPTVERLQLLTI